VTVGIFEKIAKFKITSALFGASFALILGGTLWAYGALRSVKGLLILHYSNTSGIDYIGSFEELFKISAIGAIAICMNFILALELEERDMFLARLLAGASVFIGLLIFIGFAAIISVN